jgi:hypothetical protein
VDPAEVVHSDQVLEVLVPQAREIMAVLARITLQVVAVAQGPLAAMAEALMLGAVASDWHQALQAHQSTMQAVVVVAAAAASLQAAHHLGVARAQCV